MKTNNSRLTIIKFILFIIIISFIIILAIEITPHLVDFSSDPDEARKFMLSNKLLGGLLFLLIQIAHVIIAFIPGDMLYVLGGFVFGIPMGFLLSYTGVMVGSVIVFYLSRWLGYDFVNKFVSKKKINKISKILNSTKGMLGLFIICLIPIIPKDPLTYVSGLTPMKASKLFLVYAISRIPIILMWVIVGASAYKQNYAETAITIAILILIAILGVIVRKLILKKNQILD